VTTADSKPGPASPAVKPATPSAVVSRPKVDFACVREHVTMEQVLQHLGYFASLRGRGQQRRGPCPVHSQPTAPERTFSVHLGKNAFQCFHAECAVKGNVLDLWAAIHRLPLYEAALDLAETFQVPRNREEALRLLAIRQARPDPLAFSVSGPERTVNGWAAASGEKRIDFVCRNRLVR
ncbi:MAG: CHC2 zinc finger domain-containing protein, partial [Isosphaeraceae bacterium]